MARKARCVGAAPLCAILLGVASEELADELIHRTRLTEDNKKLFQKKAGSTRATAADRAHAIQEIWASAQDLPDKLKSIVDTKFPLAATTFRDVRNKGGHPNKLGSPTRPELFVSLNMFPMYCRDVKELIDWMREDQSRVF